MIIHIGRLYRIKQIGKILLWIIVVGALLYILRSLHFQSKWENYPKEQRLNLLEAEINSVIDPNELTKDYAGVARYRYDRYNSRNKPDNCPGSLGKGHYLNLTGEDLRIEEELLETETFNVLVSNEIPLYRTLPDYRLTECKQSQYNISTLPTASVVAAFHNEDLRIIMRTVNSIVNRSPPTLLKEVILVDDFSDRKELTGMDINDYINKQWPDGVVKVIKLGKRSGFPEAKSRGAQHAIGDVVILMKAECEVSEGWLEPLLQRIKEKRSAILYPALGFMNGADMSVFGMHSDYHFFGSFEWDLDFEWYPLPKRERIRRKSRAIPILSPIMLPPILVADRKYFFDIGGYDTAMTNWEGDNIEIAIRNWMCGGSVELVTCSVVARIWRRYEPPRPPWNINHANFVRIAESLMDDYKRLYYMYRPQETADIGGNVTGRLDLLKKLNCHSFKWFLDNVIPEKFILDEHSIGHGRVENVVDKNRLCLDILVKIDKPNLPITLGVNRCRKKRDMKQFFSLSLWNELRQEKTCARLKVEASSQGVEVVKVLMNSCSRQANDVPSKPNEIWAYDATSGHIMNKSLKKCLTTLGVNGGEHVLAADCNSEDAHQVWKFEHWRSGDLSSYNVTHLN